MPPKVRVVPANGLGPFLSALPRAERREVTAGIRRSVGTLRENRKALADELSAILTTIRAKPYQHDALQNLFSQQQDRMSERGATSREILLAVIETMSDKERAAFADRMQVSIEQAVRRVRENAERR